MRGDKGISYGRIMEVMATITQGGFTKVALLAEQTGGPPTAAGGSRLRGSLQPPPQGPSAPCHNPPLPAVPQSGTQPAPAGRGAARSTVAAPACPLTMTPVTAACACKPARSP